MDGDNLRKRDVAGGPHDCRLRRDSELCILACTIHHIQGCQRHPVVAPETQGKEVAEEQLLEGRAGWSLRGGHGYENARKSKPEESLLLAESVPSTRRWSS